MKLKKKEIKVPIYTGKLLLISSDSEKKIRKELNGFESDEIYAHSIHFCDDEGENGYAIVLNFKDPKYAITHGVIAHEAYHIVSYIAELHGFEWNPHNDEPMAYLMGWVVDQIYIFAKENNLKVHIKRKK